MGNQVIFFNYFYGCNESFDISVHVLFAALLNYFQKNCKCSKEKMEKINFEQQIKDYEDMMFGLMLYQETSPKWVQKLQIVSYRNMRKRGDKSLLEAKDILSEMKKGKDVRKQIMCFEWPVILDDMRFRIEVMLQFYKELYPKRPRDRSLTEVEISALRNKAMDII